MRTYLLAALLLVALAGVARYQPAAGQSGMQLPPGYTATAVATGLNLPVDMAFMPSGDILVAEKGSGSDVDGVSHIRLVQDGLLQSDPVLALSTNVFWDSGLAGLVLDPQFAVNRYFYVWYATGENALGWSGESVMRLSRFTFNPTTGKAAPATERILLDDIPWHFVHLGGALHFDADGNLYLGIGDLGNWPVAQELDSWPGKILRIRPVGNGYVIPGDNPFVGTPGALPEIYAMGLRNPFRMARRASDDLTVMVDVGLSTWEEVNVLAGGGNYGWPDREGPCPLAEIEPCDPAPPGYIDPTLYHEHHPVFGGSITGHAFYEGATFPAAYHGALFFSEFAQSFIAVSDMSGNGFELFAENVPGVVDIAYRDERLYLLDLYNGQILAVDYIGIPNQSPSAVLAVDVDLGAPPLAVAFSAAGSSDPDDTELVYHWDFGDGTAPITTTTPAVNHTYTSEWTYTASLYVTDPRGGKSGAVERTITAYSGELPTISLHNLTEPARQLFYGGDRISFNAGRSTFDDLDADTPFTWRVELVHNNHAHPVIVDAPGMSGILTIPLDNHDANWNIFYRFNLTMHLLTGQPVTVPKNMYPALILLHFDTAPATGYGKVIVNQGLQGAPFQLTSIIGVEHVAEAPAEMLMGQDIGVFESWTLSSPVQTSSFYTSTRILTLVAPQVTTTYVANYVYDRPAIRLYFPIIRRFD